MPVKTYGYILTMNTRLLVAPASTQPQTVTVHNHNHAMGQDAATDFTFIGGSDVTATNGLHVTANQSILLYLNAGEDLYAITSNIAGSSLRVLAVTKS